MAQESSYKVKDAEEVTSSTTKQAGAPREWKQQSVLVMKSNNGQKTKMVVYSRIVEVQSNKSEGLADALRKGSAKELLNTYLDRMKSLVGRRKVVDMTVYRVEIFSGGWLHLEFEFDEEVKLS